MITFICAALGTFLGCILHDLIFKKSEEDECKKNN